MGAMNKMNSMSSVTAVLLIWLVVLVTSYKWLDLQLNIKPTLQKTERYIYHHSGIYIMGERELYIFEMGSASEQRYSFRSISPNIHALFLVFCLCETCIPQVILV